MLLKSHSLSNKTPVKIPHKVLHKSTTIVVTGAHYGYNCPPKVSIIPDPESFNNQTVDELPQTLPSFDLTCYSGDENSFTYDSQSNIVHDSPNVFNPPLQPSTYSYKFYGNDAYYGHDCPLQLEEKQLEEERSTKAQNWKLLVCYDDDDDEERSDSLDDNIISGLPTFSAITPNEPVLFTEEPDNSLSMGDEHLNTIPTTESDEVIKSSVENLIPIPTWDRVSKIKDDFGNKQYKPDDIQELIQKLFNDVQNIHEELGEYINTPSWNPHAFYNYDDDNDEDYTIAITPILSTEDPVDSLIMEDEHLDTIPATKSDDVIKSSVKDLVPIPSESEGILDNMCDVPFRDNSLTLDISKDQSLILTMILLRLMTIISLLATSIMLRHRLLIMSTST
nr:hypothetical protein [Tanacetum cinerariifolium]